MKFAPGTPPRLILSFGGKSCPGYERVCSETITRKGKRGPLPKYCTGCRRLKQRAEWRGVKQRRADRYGRHAGVGGQKERSALSRGRATRWRFLAYYDGVENVAYIKTQKDLMLPEVKNAS